jgi:hypothetical protein
LNKQQIHTQKNMSNSDQLYEIAENLKDARQYALLGNYERSIVFFKGIMRDLNQLMQHYDENKTKASRADLQVYRTQIDKELKQVEELENSVNAFRALLTPSVQTPPAYNYNNPSNNFNYNNIAYMGGGGMNFGHPFQGDPYQNEPERDPDVWPPPPPLKNHNRNGFAAPNQNSPKHYKGKQVNGSDIKPGLNNNMPKQLSKGNFK